MISWGRVCDFHWGWAVGSNSLILDISNIARVSVGNVVGHNLGAAIGKGNTILAVGGVAITGLVLAKVGTRVLISYAVLKGVDSWAIIGGLLVAMDWGRVVGS